MTSYDRSVKNEVNLCPLLHFRTPKCNTAATVTQLVDQKLNVGPVWVHSTWGIAAGVFLEARGQAFQKSSGLQPKAKYPKFHPKPQNLANYDKASNDLR